jgi:hypothetical protein
VNELRWQVKEDAAKNVRNLHANELNHVKVGTCHRTLLLLLLACLC